MRHDVCASAELAAGGIAHVQVDARDIAVIRTSGGDLHAVAGRCLHQGALLSGGRLLAGVDGEHPGEYRLLDGREVLKCPWHGYEYDVATGCALFDPRRRLRSYEVAEHEGRVVVEVA